MFVDAVEQLSMALEDERESVKAGKKKNSNVIKDLQKQLQSSNRYIFGHDGGTLETLLLFCIGV